ncbi:hypothetical protein [Dyadobacter bucti]|uniref:hypothetical protein n=1 Tax=Dyadobacter bucti TaxID=2572203 RepID=UPI001107EEC8|nr:hypothetical protein [Dyadobacter bucti]
MIKIYTKHNPITLFLSGLLALTATGCSTILFSKLSGLFDALTEQYDPQGFGVLPALAGMPSIRKTVLPQFALVSHAGTFRNSSPHIYSILS